MEDELEGEHVAGFEALDGASHQQPEVVLHPIRGDRRSDRFVGRNIVGEQRDVADVALVATASAAEVTKADAAHG